MKLKILRCFPRLARSCIKSCGANSMSLHIVFIFINKLEPQMVKYMGNSFLPGNMGSSFGSLSFQLYKNVELECV